MKNMLRHKSSKILGTLILGASFSGEALAAPVAQPDRLNTTVGVPKTVGVLWNDRGSGLYISNVNQWSKHGGQMYTLAGGRKIHYTPKAGFSGTDSFWYEITDAHGRTNSAKVTVRIKQNHHARARHHNPQPKHKPSYNVQWSQPGFSLSYSKPGGIEAHFGAPQQHHAQPQAGGQQYSGGNGSDPIGHPDAFTTYAASGQVPLYVLSNDQGYGLKVLKTNPWTRNGGQSWVVNNHTGSYIMYTPKPGFVGVDELWYVLRDANGRTNSTRVNINVW